MAALLVKRDDEESDEEVDEIQELFDKIPEPDLVIENSSVHVKRPWIQNFLLMSEKKQEPKKVLTEKEKEERRERIRLMEIERKKDLKKAKARLDLKRQRMENQDRVCFIFCLFTNIDESEIGFEIKYLNHILKV